MFYDRRPVLGQDPFVFRHEGILFLVESEDEKVIVLKELEGLDTLKVIRKTIIWNDTKEQQVWAPELHEVDGFWYLYYAASNGNNRMHRMFVCEAETPWGPFEHRRRIGPDIWGIDLTIFEMPAKNSTTMTSLFGVWSGWENHGDEFPQHLYIAEMHGPYVLGERVKLSTPILDWEKGHRPILEGPQAIRCPITGGLFLTYSANASWTQDYCIGMLELIGDNPLNPAHWYKFNRPQLWNAGHGSFVDNSDPSDPSVGGSFVYHRKLSSLHGWSDRELAVLPFSWDDGRLVIGGAGSGTT